MAVLPDGALMQQAAAGLAAAVSRFLGRTNGARVLLLVGSGDNGGDALFAGVRLARRGAYVEAVLLAPARAHQGGLTAFEAAGGRVVATPRRPDVVVDGIVGIGGVGGLRPDAAALVDSLRGVPVVSVDLPSGVDCDSGEVHGAHVVADLTVTFGTHKVAHLVDPSARVCGTIELIELGLDLPEAAVVALQAEDVRRLLPRPETAAHKYTRGVVGVRTGSADYPGAAVLSVAGANCGLAGMVRYVGTAADDVVRAHPEVVAGAGRVQSWVVGSGGGQDAAGALEAALQDGVPVVIDADALSHLGAYDLSNCVLTPHAGELAAMLHVERAVVESAPLQQVREAAARWGCVVLLKGPHTLIAEPSGSVFANTTGTSWLATAGAGDVLAGLIGSLLSAGLAPAEAAAVGAWLHGASASQAATRRTLTAGPVAAELPRLIAAMLRA